MDNVLREKIKEYYTGYYRDDCPLPDWEVRVEARVKEDALEAVRMKKLEKLLDVSFSGQRHCIIGAGTGGLAVVLAKEYGVDVYGVEPSREEMDIIRLQCKTANISEDHFREEPCETLSFEDNMFDVVHCFTVLEHVEDIDTCLDQMIRVTKPGGKIYISTPNYAFPYERHYKVPFPTFLPKWVGALFLRILGRSPAFLKTINFVTERQTQRLLFRKKGIVWYRLYKPHAGASGRFGKVWDWLIFRRGMSMNQDIIIRKR